MRRVFPAAVLAALFFVPGAGAWAWPAAGDVVQPFSFDPAHPYAAGQHRGVDIAGDAGSTVVAPEGGSVSFAGTVPTSGKSVTILTGDGYAVTLTHLGSVLVTKGAAVAEGDAVGTIGPSGDPEVATPYVHLGIRIASDEEGYLDPAGFLPARAATAPPSEAVPSPVPAPPPTPPTTGDAPTAPAAPVAAAVPTAVAAAPAASTGSVSTIGPVRGRLPLHRSRRPLPSPQPATVESAQPRPRVQRPARAAARDSAAVASALQSTPSHAAPATPPAARPVHDTIHLPRASHAHPARARQPGRCGGDARTTRDDAKNQSGPATRNPRSRHLGSAWRARPGRRRPEASDHRRAASCPRAGGSRFAGSSAAGPSTARHGRHRSVACVRRPRWRIARSAPQEPCKTRSYDCRQCRTSGRRSWWRLPGRMRRDTGTLATWRGSAFRPTPSRATTASRGTTSSWSAERTSTVRR